MARFRVLVAGSGLVSYLELPLWETARAALRLLCASATRAAQYAVRHTDRGASAPVRRYA